MLVGLFALYATVHFFIFQHTKNWSQRSSYEKVITVVAMVMIGLVFLSVMNN